MTIHGKHGNAPFSDFEKADAYQNTPEDYEEIPVITVADFDRATYKVAGIPAERPYYMTDADDPTSSTESSVGFYLAAVCVAILTFAMGLHFHSAHAWGASITCFTAFFFLTLLLLVELMRSMKGR